MCVAIPMEVVKIDGSRGVVRSAGVELDLDGNVVRSSGVELEIGLDLVENVAVGDYVLLHAGYAIQSLSAEDARETLAVFERLLAT